MKINKNLDNLDIVDLLRAVSCAYIIKDEAKNKFKIIAYERAADAIEHLSSEVKDLYDDNKLTEIPGVGKSIADDLKDVFKYGKSIHIKNILKGINPAVFELIKLSFIGPKSAWKLCNLLRIDEKKPIESLEYYAKKGMVSKLPEFGIDSEKKILVAIEEFKKRVVRHLINYAEEIARELNIWLESENACENIEVLGSLRRKTSTIGDIDIAVSTNKPDLVIKHFISFPKSKRTIEKGDGGATIELPGNVKVDLRVINPLSFGSMIQHFTGSKHHNVALREYAKSLSPSLSLSEYGIRNIKTGNSIKQFRTEKEFYEFLGMKWIPPELREDNGEIQAALNDELPNLVELSDIKSDLQVHSNFNTETSHDLGQSNYQEITKKAIELGYQYLAFTDHNPSLSKHKPFQITDILKKRKVYIEDINYSLNISNRVISVYNSLEIDILSDGKLPISQKDLESLDFALVSIHSSFYLNKEKQTKRILRAFENPKIKIFAHPTGRLLNEREGVQLDWEIIFDYCKNKNIWIEINADPQRLDLPDYLVKDAIKNNVKLTLGTDSHCVNQMENMKYALYCARRGWAEKMDIINCLPYKDFDKMIKS